MSPICKEIIWLNKEMNLSVFFYNFHIKICAKTWKIVKIKYITNLNFTENFIESLYINICSGNTCLSIYHQKPIVFHKYLRMRITDEICPIKCFILHEAHSYGLRELYRIGNLAFYIVNLICALTAFRLPFQTENWKWM